MKNPQHSVTSDNTVWCTECAREIPIEHARIYRDEWFCKKPCRYVSQESATDWREERGE